jgi:FkbM family methyltransferase
MTFSATLHSYAQLANDIRHVQRSGMSRRLRSQAIRNQIWLNLVPLPNPARIMGYKVAYFRAAQLRYLFSEVFMHAGYYFESNTKKPRIFDCGSNIGMSILFFKTIFPDAIVTGFEPDHDTYKTLKINVENNRLDAVDVHNVALSDTDGIIDFFRDPSDLGSLVMSVDERRGRGERITVQARRLSTYIEGPVDLLKMDIEGAEHRALPELAASGKLHLVKHIHLEYHHHIDSGSDCLSDILSLLEREGFGYQIKATPEAWTSPGAFQDISIFCYRKSG